MWWVYFLIAGCIGIGVVLGLKKNKQLTALRNDGKIVNRKYNYAANGEAFTAKIGSYDALRDQLQKFLPPCGREGSTSTVVKFKSASFAARLYKVDFDAASGIGIFRFEFTQWRTGRYGYEEDTLMNMLMTAVEKTFLALDPNTGVKSYELNVKTKHSLL